MSKRSLLVFTNTLVGGGAEKQLLLTVRGLAADGVRCRVYGLRPMVYDARYAKLIASCQSAGVRFFVPAHRFGAFIVVLRLCWDSLYLSPVALWTWGYRSEFIRLICPLLWFARGVLALRSASEGEIRRHAVLLKVGSRLTDLYLANSERAIELVDRIVPGITGKSAVIYNALEANFLARNNIRAPASPIRIVMLGNVRFHVKGYDFALALAQLLKSKGIPAKLTIGGRQVAHEKNLSEEIEAAGVREIVQWRGGIDDVREFLGEGDIFLLLSRYEGTSNSLLEAMAMGLPCISSAVGDVERFAEDGAGIAVVQIGDVAGVIEQIERLIQSPQLGIEMGRRNVEYCRRKFSEAAMISATKAALFGERAQLSREALKIGAQCRRDESPVGKQ